MITVLNSASVAENAQRSERGSVFHARNHCKDVMNVIRKGRLSETILLVGNLLQAVSRGLLPIFSSSVTEKMNEVDIPPDAVRSHGPHLPIFEGVASCKSLVGGDVGDNLFRESTFTNVRSAKIFKSDSPALVEDRPIYRTSSSMSVAHEEASGRSLVLMCNGHRDKQLLYPRNKCLQEQHHQPGAHHQINTYCCTLSGLPSPILSASSASLEASRNEPRQQTPQIISPSPGQNAPVNCRRCHDRPQN